MVRTQTHMRPKKHTYPLHILVVNPMRKVNGIPFKFTVFADTHRPRKQLEQLQSPCPSVLLEVRIPQQHSVKNGTCCW